MIRLRALIPVLLTLTLVLFLLPSEKKTSPSPDTSATSSSTSISTSPSPQKVTSLASAQPDLTLPPIDHTPLLREAKDLEKKGRYRFATSRPTNIAPHLGGTWTTTSDRAQWNYKLQSTDAHSLNLGFSEFHLPTGASLTISDPSGQSEALTFTSKDNDSHQELWTPIFPTDQLALTLDLPKQLASDLRLRLTKVNHGFRDKAPTKFLKAIGNTTSSSCHIDVICDPSDDPTFGPLVDLFRDQIRSVAAYTIGGIETCSGALINNTNNDNTPFFLTANHCGINAQNAASIVVYWNFESASCRTPDSSNSGANGNGPLTDFNSGAIFRAARIESDFCLIELDDLVDPSFQPFFAGWDRSGTNPTSVTGIHHPVVAEKRISFELDPTTTTNSYDDDSTSSGTHIRVADWDFGTTEGGSSGSALFDDSGRIIGQLDGGNAACGNNLADWYGRLSRSWSDGGTAASQLSSWLDPSNTNLTAIDGINSNEILTVTGGSINEGDSGNATFNATVTLSNASDETVTVTLMTQLGTASATDFTPLSQTITFNPGETFKVIPISITGDTNPEEHETIFLHLLNSQNAIATTEPSEIIILNDDFITPVITSALSAEATVYSSFEYRITAQNTPTSYSIANPPIGMTFDSLTGIMTWIPDSPSTQNISITATNPAGSDTQILSITTVPNTLAIALDLSSTVSLTSSDPSWFSQTITSFDGIDSARSGNINDNESSSMSMQVTGPDRIAFQWKVSSELGFDQLSFFLDGKFLANVLPSISGEVDWTPAFINIPDGTHTLTWEYAKDGLETAGSDAAWVDDIRFASGQRPIIWAEEENLVIVGSAARVPLEFINADSSGFTALPSWLTYQANSHELVGTPPSAGTYTITAIATGAGESISHTFSLIAETDSPALAAAIDQPNLTVIASSSDPWTIVSDITSTGGTHARSGNISNGETSSLTLLVQGPGTLRFNWKVSSELGYDLLYYTLDSTFVAQISGEIDWQEIAVPLTPGLHQITWTYDKDGTDSDGSDTGFIDNITLSGFAQFLTEHALDHMTSYPSDDPEGNGFSLFHEYAFLLSPGDSSDNNLLTLSTPSFGTANLSFEALPENAGVQYLIETNSTLLSTGWSPLSGTLQSTPLPQSAQYSQSIPFPSTNEPRLFYRIRSHFE